jgi:uncharacterized membrane protein
MAILDVLLTWIHVLCVVIFLGAMFVATFAMMPVLKATVPYEQRHKFVVNFIPKVRKVMRVVVSLLVVSGVGRALLLHFTHEGPASAERLAVFGAKIFFAAVPVVIFIVAPKVLGKYSKDHLCCDPDAEDPPIAHGVMTSLGTGLHYAAISGGWVAVLLGIVLTHMR